MNPSPLRYPGGKYKLYNYIKNVVEINDCSTYIEPFCGGAAIACGMLINGNIKRAIINDYDYSIYCFWDSVINNVSELIYKIRKTDINIDEWYLQKDIKNNYNLYSNLDVGFATLFLNRTNHSGIIDKAGPIGGYNQEGKYKIDCRFNKEVLIDKVKKINEHKDQIQLYNMEANDFIDEIILSTRKSFTFFDPPYYNKGSELYASFYAHEDHKELALHIQEKMKNRKWITTYDDDDEIKKMYNFRGVKCREYELNYYLQNKRKDTELMFISSDSIIPQL